ncbi:MAG: DRTGG domain-containing protein [Thermoanaerobacteraceae bacterium]
MKLKQVRSILEAEVLAGNDNLDSEIYSACGADLMSDVLASKDQKSLLLTGLTNVQVIRTAQIIGDVRCIVFVRGKKPCEEILKLAEQSGITIMRTKYPLYVACGLLYKNGLVCKESD